MANDGVHQLLSYYCLTAPLDPNPSSELDRVVNKLRLKYRTYRIDLDPDYGVVMLPITFGSDFGDEIDRYVTLVDSNNNEFEIEVERNNSGIFLTKGLHAMRDFYGIGLGVSVKILFVGLGKFTIKKIKTRFGQNVPFPKFIPSMKFVIEKNFLPFQFFSGVPTPFSHDQKNFEFSYDKKLSSHEIESGYLMLAYQGFCHLTLSKRSTSLKLVDDCGNIWNCTLMYATRPFIHFKIGGGFKRMILARRLCEGVRVKVGAPNAGINETIYFSVFRN